MQCLAGVGWLFRRLPFAGHLPLHDSRLTTSANMCPSIIINASIIIVVITSHH
jgi:hypothetical protein